MFFYFTNFGIKAQKISIKISLPLFKNKTRNVLLILKKRHSKDDVAVDLHDVDVALVHA